VRRSSDCCSSLTSVSGSASRIQRLVVPGHVSISMFNVGRPSKLLWLLKYLNSESNGAIHLAHPSALIQSQFEAQFMLEISHKYERQRRRRCAHPAEAHSGPICDTNTEHWRAPEIVEPRS
jgi:hypothetical protein